MKITTDGAVTTVLKDDIQYGRDYYIMLRSDAHHDSIHCDRKLEKQHLDYALDHDAMVMDAGDLYDAMQGRFDPRRSYDDIRPEYRASNYYDLIEDDAVKFYAPYANNFVLMGKGNHEKSVLKNSNIDLTSRLVSRLNREHKGNIVTGGYGGWVVLRLKMAGNNDNHTIRIKYFHGSGGEAPVTRGVIQTNRQMVYLPDADIIWNGHNHNNYVIPIKRERISNKNRQYFDVAWNVRTPGYKNDYGLGTDGWEVERGGVPKPLGCVMIRYKFNSNDLELFAYSLVV